MSRAQYEIIGAAFDLGTQKRGCAQAPSVLRASGLTHALSSPEGLGRYITDGGDVVGATEGDDTTWPRNLAQLMSFSGDLMQRLERSYALHHRPVVLGGDHSISIPSVSAGSRFLRETHGAEAPLGLIWVDAHPDLETPDTTTSGDLHGMPVAVLLGHGAPDLCHLGGFAPKVDPRHVVYIGLRDVLPEERAIIQQYGITAYSASDVEGLGIAEICERTFTFMAEHAAGFVLSFDIDACDPSEAPAVQYPEPGGLTRREARVIMEYAAQAPNLTCLELVELDPSLDTDTRTSDLGLWLLRAALAGPIL